MKRKKRINLFYVPAVIVMLVFIAYPLGRAIYLSLFKWNGYSSNMEFIGLKNYASMFTDKIFYISIRNTLIYGFGSTILQQIVGLALALFLDSRFKGRGLWLCPKNCCSLSSGKRRDLFLGWQGFYCHGRCRPQGSERSEHCPYLW